MNPKEIKIGVEASKSLADGCRKLAEVVSATLGPGGRPAFIEVPGQDPFITKDGVTVAKHTTLEDAFENMGCSALKSVASRTNDQEGDGTTTATILANEIIQEGLALRSNESAFSPKDYMAALDDVAKAFSNFCKAYISDVVVDGEIDFDLLRKVAMVSSNGDEVVSDAIVEIYKEIGQNALIEAVSSDSDKLTIDKVKGYWMDKGYYDDDFSNVISKDSFEANDPYILVYNDSISTLEHGNYILSQIYTPESSADVPLVIICHELTDAALSMFRANIKQAPHLNICVIEAPYYGNKRLQLLDDLAACCGATALNSDDGIGLKNLDISHFGKASRVQINGGRSTFMFDTYGPDYNYHLEGLKIRLDEATENVEINDLEERISRLSGGLGVIKVGGHSSLEVRERKDRVVDAISACDVALRNGVLPGGASMMFMYYQKMVAQAFNDNRGETYNAAYAAVINSLMSPLKTLLKNAYGEDEANEIIDTKAREMSVGQCIDINTKEIVNAFDSGILDPSRVTIMTLENAVSVAKQVVTTSATITFIRMEYDKQ